MSNSKLKVWAVLFLMLMVSLTVWASEGALPKTETELATSDPDPLLPPNLELANFLISLAVPAESQDPVCLGIDPPCPYRNGCCYDLTTQCCYGSNFLCNIC